MNKIETDRIIVNLKNLYEVGNYNAGSHFNLFCDDGFINTRRFDHWFEV